MTPVYLATMNRSVLLLIAAAIGVLISFTTAVNLVPRVRLVDVVLVFFGAFGAGAAFTAAVVELKTKRESRPSVRGRPLAVFLLIAVLSGERGSADRADGGATGSRRLRRARRLPQRRRRRRHRGTRRRSRRCPSRNMPGVTLTSGMARYVHRPLVGPRAARRRVRDVRIESGRVDRSGENARSVACHRLQLRLPRSPAEAAKKGRRSFFSSFFLFRCAWGPPPPRAGNPCALRRDLAVAGRPPAPRPAEAGTPARARSAATRLARAAGALPFLLHSHQLAANDATRVGR